MSEIKKFIFPAAVVFLGIAMIIYANLTDQNGAYILGSFAILLAGLVSIVAAFIELSKMLRTVISAGLTVIVLGLAYADYMSIKVPIEFQAEKERRYTHVIQRLKDIRTAELAYKAIYQKYLGNTDSLVNFIKHDSIPSIKAIGEVPDTMTLDQAIKEGIVSRDTNYTNVLDSLFGGKQDDRVHHFHADSFVVVPFTGGKAFKLEAGFVERSGIKVPVFQATDPVPFDHRDPKQVGSMTDPKTNGNWE
ncbi:MAG: hypothetical protein HQ500_03880 [Flavobacteriales bacterium]|nr:hypothetical protein [Flavobacteriales bacterium]